MIHPHVLKAEDIQAYTHRIMKTHFEIEAHGYTCTTDMIYDLLLKASAECSSLEAACADLEEVADSNTVREYVNRALPSQSLVLQRHVRQLDAENSGETASVCYIWRQFACLVRLKSATLRCNIRPAGRAIQSSVGELHSGEHGTPGH